MTNEQKLEKERREGLALKYNRIKKQLASLNNFDAVSLLFYLVGFNSNDQRFVDEVDYWLNDPQYGRLTRADREKAKAE